MLDFKLASAGSLAVALGLVAVATWAPTAHAGFTDGESPAEPAVDLPVAGWRLSAPLFISTRFESVSPFPTDVTGYEHSVTPIGTLLQSRLGVRADSKRSLEPLGVLLEAEAEMRSAAVPESAVGIGTAYEPGRTFTLRKAYARLAFINWVQLTVGAQLSHWGLGLLSNDGAHGWTPGSARFSDPVDGDRVLRAALSTRPTWGDFTLTASAAADYVLGDDILNVEGDTAVQGVVALQLDWRSLVSGGVYVVRRHQQELAGGTIDVWAVDATARAAHKVLLADGVQLSGSIEAEGVGIFGETNVAPSVSHPTHEIVQLGAAARATAQLGPVGTVLELVYASGDQNLEDGAQNGFRADPNYEVGVLMFRHLNAGITHRIPTTAGDPELVGKPAPGLDRAPSNGSVTNTFAIFPRLLFVPTSGVEIFGGPLLAFAPARPVDPLQTRLAGGSTRNAYGAEPGTLLGTELDVGTRVRFVFFGAELVGGLEAAVLFPGDAFVTPTGLLDPIYGGRATLTARL